MYHKSKDSQLSCTSVIQLNSTLGELGLLIEGIPSEVKRLITEVTRELSPSYVLHNEEFKKSDEGDDLKKSSLGDCSNSSPSIGDRVESSSSGINISGKVDSSTGDDISKECKLTDTSVLELDITEAVETLLVSVIKKSKRIEESKRGLNSELGLESIKDGRGLNNLGGCKSSSGSEKGSED
jgi:hypothetical protein